MSSSTFQATLHNITQILRAIDEIGVQADALAQIPASAPEGRHALADITGNLDRIISKAQEVELLVGILPEDTVAAALQAPSTQLREAVTTFVVSAYGAAATLAEKAAPAAPAPALAVPDWLFAA